MFRKITLSLTVAGLLCAQSNVQVHKTELAVPFGVAAGKLAVMDQNLVFVDDEKPEASFAIARESVKQLTAEAETVTVELSKAIRDRSGDRTQLHFRMPTPAAATTLSQWYQAKPVRAGAAGITAAGSAPDVPPTATYAAKHKHFPFGECSGRLLVFDGRLAYESVTEVNHSRAWQFRDIKEAKQKSPYEIELGPFDGNNYTFLMGEKGMAPPEFKALVDKITAARAAR